MEWRFLIGDVRFATGRIHRCPGTGRALGQTLRARSPIANRKTSINHQESPLAFSLIEILIVLMVLSIAAAIAVPRMGQTTGTKLVEAARLLAADLGHAQVESITHADAPRAVVFDPAGEGYAITLAADPTTPVIDPIGNRPYVVTFGQGRARALTGVRIASLDVGGDDTLAFGIYGQLDQATDAVITLACQDSTITLTVQSSTGGVTLSGVE